MQSQTVEIRLELLKKVGEGFSQRETVKHLAEKFDITESGAYYHFETRDKWLGQYCNFDKNFAFQVRQRFNYIYREASFQYQHAQDHNAKIGYLRTMLEANGKCAEYLPADAQTPSSIELSFNHKPDWMVPLDAYSPEEKEVLDKAVRIFIEKRKQFEPQGQGHNRSGLH